MLLHYSFRFNHACSVVKDRETKEIMAVVAGGDYLEDEIYAITMSGAEVLFQGSNEWQDWVPLPLVRLLTYIIVKSETSTLYRL